MRTLREDSASEEKTAIKKNRPTRKEFQARRNRLREDLSKGIASGSLALGTSLPSEIELAQKYHLSRASAREVLAVMERDGLLTRLKGVGTIVGKQLQSSKKSKSIAVMSPPPNPQGAGFETPARRSVIISEIITIELLNAGFNVYNFSGFGQSGDVDMIVDRLRSQQIRGLVLVQFCADYASVLTARANACGIHVVDVLGVSASNPFASTVSFNNHQVGSIVAKHLIDSGHRRPVCLGICRDHLWVRERIDGFMSACEASGIAPSHPLFFPEIKDVRTGEEWFRIGKGRSAELLNDKEFDSVFCVNDALAAGVLEMARDMGISVPQQWSLVGCDDDMLFGEYNLTTVNLNCMQASRSAASLLSDALGESPTGIWPVSLKICPIQVVRDTTAPRREGVPLPGADILRKKTGGRSQTAPTFES